MTIVLLVLSILIFFTSSAQININISATNIEKHIRILASDSLEGRGTGSDGKRKAANYIASSFYNSGVKAIVPNDTLSYFQAFNIYLLNSYVLIEGDSSKKFKNIDYSRSSNTIFRISKTDNDRDFLYFSGKQNIHDRLSEVVYSKNEIYNINPNDFIFLYEETGIKGLEKIEKIKNELSHNKFIISVPEKYFKKLKKQYPSNRFVESANKNNTDSIYYKTGLLRLKELTFSESIKKYIEYSKTNPEVEIFISGNDLTFEIFGLPLSKLINKENNVRSHFRSKIYHNSFSDTYISTENVIGYIEGSEKKDEIIVIGAHYDHLGKDRNGNIYYGADDNASGTAALIEIAKWFKEAKIANIYKPKRSLLFIAFGAEEMGLIGSDFYINQPIFPLEQTVGMINMDMIGRNHKNFSNYEGYSYMLAFGNKKGKLKRTVKNANKSLGELKLILSPNPFLKLLYSFGSDHYGFARKKIPSVVFFTGLHNDYHTTRDTPNKIDFENNARIARLACLFIINWADR